MPIVTKDSLNKLLQQPNRQHVIGRALVAIFGNQTAQEQNSDATILDNNIGFTGADARSGSLTAKAYKRNGFLQEWQIAKWIKPAKDGFPRLCKYHKQLNAIAEKKAALKQGTLV